MKWDDLQENKPKGKTVKWDDLQETQPVGSEGGGLGQMAEGAANVGTELISAINRGTVDVAEFLTTDQINNILQMAGKEKIPGISDIPFVKEATTGNFMEPGLAKEAVRAGGELVGPAAAIGTGLRGAAQMAPKVQPFIETARQGVLRQLGKTTTLQDVSAAIASGAGREVGGEIGEDIGGETGRQVGEAVGAIGAPMVAAAGTAMAKPTISRAFAKAHKLGYKIPPVLAKGTKTQQFMEGAAGPVPTKQKASIHNQQITNKLVKKDIGYPDDVPLSSDGLNAVRAEAGKAYDNVKIIGVFKSDKPYKEALTNITKQNSALQRDFPGAVRKDISDMVNTYTRKQMSSEGTVEAVKQLRADSSAGFNSTDPAISGMARAKGKVADALEKLMERQASKTHPDLVPALKAARQRIAKTYTVEKALKGENIDAVALGRMLDKGKPLSGAMRDIAEVGQNFKGAVQTNVPQQSNFRPMDVVAGVGAAGYMQQPGYLAAMGARPAIRSILLSKPYQKMLASVKPGAIKRILSLAPESQTGAIAALLDEFNSLQNTTQTDSQQ